jgi:CO/xanthine dehydrogenase FAD-binding subunit
MGTYVRPADLDEALDVLAAGVHAGRPAVVVAGATDHYPARVGRVVDEDILDISGLRSLRAIEHRADGWLIPAGATWTDVTEAKVSQMPPLFDGLRAAARAIGGLQIQNRATIVGNACNASPAADGLPNLLVLDAVVEIASRSGSRRVPVAEFVTGNRATILRPDELVTGLFIPEPDGSARSAFLKLGSRAYLVISIAMVAAVLVTDAHRRITSARVAVGACSVVAARLPGLERELTGRTAAPGLEAVVSPEHVAALAPIDDIRASASHRRDAAEVLVRRALAELVA